MKFGEIIADYYDDIASYYKVIMNEFEDKNFLKQIIVKEIFNGLLNSLDKDLVEVKIREILFASLLMESKLSKMDIKERKDCIKLLYDNYVEPMIYSYQNGDLDLVKYLFNYLHEKIKETSGYYGIFGDTFMVDSSNFVSIRNSK